VDETDVIQRLQCLGMQDADLDALTWMRQLSPQQRRALREHASLSRCELAASVGVSRDGLTKWELDTGARRTPTGAAAIRYARLLTRLQGQQQDWPA